jgi:hypothetical protein
LVLPQKEFATCWWSVPEVRVAGAGSTATT